MPFYVNTFAGQSGQAVVAAHRNDQFAAIASAFDVVESHVNRDLRAPGVESLTVLPAVASRSNRYLQFDGSGDSVGMLTGINAHTSAANPASIKKLTGLSSGDEWYPVLSLLMGEGSTFTASADATITGWSVMATTANSTPATISFDSGSVYYARSDGEITIKQAGTYMIYLSGALAVIGTAFEVEVNGASFTQPLITDAPATGGSNTFQQKRIYGVRTLAANDVLRPRMNTSTASTSFGQGIFWVVKVA